MSPNKPNKFKNNNFVRKFERPAYNNKNEGNTKITCYNCKGNHYIRECKKPRRATHKVNQVIECNDEEEANGIKYSSVFMAISDEIPLLSTYGLVNGVELQLSFDTGATASIISLTVVKKYKFRILPSDIKIKTADNTITKVIGTASRRS